MTVHSLDGLRARLMAAYNALPVYSHKSSNESQHVAAIVIRLLQYLC